MAGRFSFSQWQSRATAGIGGMAAIVASWGMGLFDNKPKPPPPVLHADRVIAAGEWGLRFDRASLSDLLPDGGRIAGAGRKAIILYVQATNRTAATSSSIVQAIKLGTAIPGADARPVPYLVRDRTVNAALQPALPEQMALMWTYPATARVPAAIRFAVLARTFKAFDNLYAQPGWFDSREIGVVDMPVGASAPAMIGNPS